MRIRIKPAVSAVVALALVAAFSVADPARAAGPTAVTTTFASGPGWKTGSGDAQAVCLNTWSMPCPAGAVDFGSPYSAWTSDLGSIPGAQWVWRPGITASTNDADLDRVSFSRTIVSPGAPTSAWVSIAADDYAEIRVNGSFVGSIGSVDPVHGPQPAYGSLTTFDVTAYVRSGANRIEIVAQNGPAATWGYCGSPCAFSSNPGGVVFGGAITVGTPPAPPAGAVKIRPFQCEGNGGQTVPADTPMYIGGGYFSGSHGLVQAAISADGSTVTETRTGATTTRPVSFGPIYSPQPGIWRSDWENMLFAPLAAGQSTTLRIQFEAGHPLTDLMLPSSSFATVFGVDYDGTGLQYHDHLDVSGDVTCVVTAA